MAATPNIAERGMAVGLGALNRVASSSTIDRLGLRDPAVRLLHGASKTNRPHRGSSRPDLRRSPAAHPPGPPTPYQA